MSLSKFKPEQSQCPNRTHGRPRARQSWPPAGCCHWASVGTVKVLILNLGLSTISSIYVFSRGQRTVFFRVQGDTGAAIDLLGGYYDHRTPYSTVLGPVHPPSKLGVWTFGPRGQRRHDPRRLHQFEMFICDLQD
jgi:hypothetical protein